MIVKMKETIRVGDVEVTPLAVEKRVVKVHVVGFEKPEPCEGPSLVLKLKVKNVAEDYEFAPMDNYFDRHWDGKAGSAPLTILDLGKSGAFYGGPCKWAPLGGREHREFLDGRKNVMPLLPPGEEMDSYICTDGNDRAVMARLAAHKGKLLWRVHLRRGLIDYKGKMLPAQCVIGVEIGPKDYGGA
jgi:hypothetical protein